MKVVRGWWMSRTTVWLIWTTSACRGVPDIETFLQERSQQASVAGGAGDGTAETRGESERREVSALSVPVGRADSDPSTASTTDTDQLSGEDSPVVPSGKAAHGLSD